MLEAVYPIVEGHGEQRAVPLLLRRFATEVFANPEILVFPAHRVPRGKMVKPDAIELERAAEFGRRKLLASFHRGAILLLLDADESCPAELGPKLLSRLTAVVGDIPAPVVLANREHEAWFLAAARSLRSRRRIAADAEVPPDPEGIVNPKAYLERRLLIPGAKYSEVVDQPALTAIFDLSEARAAPSFDKLWRDLARLFGQPEKQ